MNLSFRIRRVYFDQIVAGSKLTEVRRASKFWTTRARKAIRAQYNRETVTAVFVCGKRVHRRRITHIILYPNAEAALERLPSAQGRKDLGRGRVWQFILGEKC